LHSWDLTPPGPWWGLRGLAVRDGWIFDQVPAAASIAPRMEARAFRTVAFQPPLYAWLEAIGLALSTDRDPCATVLPSSAAGGLALALALMAVGPFGLVSLPVILLHRAYLRAAAPRGGRPRRWRGWLAWRDSPSVTAGVLALAIAVALATPWYVLMFARHGSE